jgi:hypothetical protein
MLGKALPKNFGNAFPRLQLATLDYNNFEGQIPTSLGNASGLWYIDLSSNYFTGQIPTSFGRLLELSRQTLRTTSLKQMETKDGNSCIH